MSVLTLPEVKTHLGIDAAVATFNTELTTFIARAESAISRPVGPLAPEEKTERVRGCDTVLYLSFPPIVSLTSVTAVDGVAVPAGQLTPTSGGRVEFTQAGSFPSRFYDVVYQSGWSTLPDDLKLAVLELVRHMFDTRRGGGAARTGSAQSERTSNTVPAAAYIFPWRVEQLLAPFLPVLAR